MTERTDPLGRRTTYDYAANGVDLLAVRQTTGTVNDSLMSYGNYTAAHQPQTITNGAGQSTTVTYNARGQILTVTNPRTETTTYGYDTQGYLTSVTGPASGPVTTYTYDGYGRARTVTDDGATVTTDYDVFDRPTATWHPDGTVERTSYDRLDVAVRTDRLGRETRFVSDALQRLVATRDPAGRVIRHVYGAGTEQLVDANGHATTWEYDRQGRVTRELRADAITATTYAYQPASGRLASTTDPKGQTTHYGYALDDALTSLSFTNAAVPTASVSYSYDPAYARVTTMQDGTGTTAYTYRAAGTPGAGQVATVDGPLPNDTITYGYDVLGRVTSRDIDGTPLTVTYDALGRVTSEVNALGTFGYTYQGTSARLAGVTYPNGQTSSYTYLPATQDHRLQTIHHQLPGGATLGRHDYTYDPVGNIVTWQQQAGTASPELWRYSYDRADQLIGAVVTSTGATPATLKRYAYGYDPAGNRLFEQIDDTVTAWTYDALNRLQTQAGGGVLQVAGIVNEPATVTIQGHRAAVTSANRFSGGLPVVPGTNIFTVTARDPNGNTSSAEYAVDVTSAPKTFTYDANGNLTADGTRTFEWDARNHLVAISVAAHRSEFTYDGLQRRVGAVEKQNGVTQANINVLWCDVQICEERAANGVTSTRRSFSQGEQMAGATRFYTSDHLGTVVDVTDGISTPLAHYTYSPWGRRNVIGSDHSAVGFTGHPQSSVGALWLALYRAYDSDLGKWLSDDPIGLSGGINFTSYVYNNPVRMADPLGLDAWSCQVPAKGSPKRPGDRKWGPDVPGNPAYHQYICVTTADGQTVCGGKRPRTPAKDPNAWYPSEPSEDYYSPAQCDRLSTKASCFERCLREKVNSANPRGPYNLLRANCQDWAKDQIWTCASECLLGSRS